MNCCPRRAVLNSNHERDAMKRLLALTGILLLCTPAWADGEVGIFPVKGANLELEAEDAIGFAFAEAYAKVSGRQVVFPDETAQVYGAAGRDAQRAAEALALFEYVVLSAVHNLLRNPVVSFID